MPKAAPDVFIDAALNTIKTNVTRIVVTSGEPANFAAVAGVTLGSSDHASSTPSTALSGTDFTGPADDTSGRKLDMNARAGIYCSAAGSATHICLTSASVLYYVTTCTSQTVAIGNKVNMPQWKVNIAGSDVSDDTDTPEDEDPETVEIDLEVQDGTMGTSDDFPNE